MKREERYEQVEPFVQWRKPAEISITGTMFPGNPPESKVEPDVFLGCKYCIMRYGIKGSNVHKLPVKETEHYSHLAQVHGQRAPGQEDFPKVKPYGVGTED